MLTVLAYLSRTTCTPYSAYYLTNSHPSCALDQSACNVRSVSSCVAPSLDGRSPPAGNDQWKSGECRSVLLLAVNRDTKANHPAPAKIGLLPKRPVSLLNTNSPPARRPSDDDELEYVENPFEERK